jgi:hypothetical protein
MTKRLKTIKINNLHQHKVNQKNNRTMLKNRKEINELDLADYEEIENPNYKKYEFVYY